MYSLYVECADSEVEMLSSELWEEGATGMQEDSLPAARCQLRAWFEDSAGLLQRFDHYQPRIESDPEIDWETVARQAWQPFAVGKRLYLAPEWDEGPTPRGRIRLTIHPGEALGTGAHPATQLCLEALEAHLRPRDCVLDLGTGSGILAAAACHLGAHLAFGCDMDFRSVEIAHRNLLTDGFRPHVFAGSTRAVRTHSIDVLVANINAVTHQTLAAEYARMSRRLLILSGFPDRNCAKVAEALDYVGVMTLEFFATENGPIFNEMAPRVHNSGHWTIEGAITSQFEQHVRAICGLPLGDTRLAAKGVVMNNLIGDEVHDWAQILSDPAHHLHLYGKAAARPGRKMGPVTRLLLKCAPRSS